MIELGEVKTTERGFQIIHFRDKNNNPCSLQQSSLAEFNPPGTSAIWLGCDEKRMHIDLSQVEKLVSVLQNWIQSGTFKE